MGIDSSNFNKVCQQAQEGKVKKKIKMRKRIIFSPKDLLFKKLPVIGGVVA